MYSRVLRHHAIIKALPSRTSRVTTNNLRSHPFDCGRCWLNFSSLSTLNDKPDNDETTQNKDDDVNVFWANDDDETLDTSSPHSITTKEIDLGLPPIRTDDHATLSGNQEDSITSFNNTEESSNELSELFKMDIFTESWRGKEILDTTPRTKRMREQELRDGKHKSSQQPAAVTTDTSILSGPDLSFGVFKTNALFGDSISRERKSQQVEEIVVDSSTVSGSPDLSFGMFNTDTFLEETTDIQSPSREQTPLKQQQQQEVDYTLPIEHPSTAIEKRYNTILQSTSNLLSALSESSHNQAPSTLQLMDYDKIMVQWSQFHIEVDATNNNNYGTEEHDTIDRFITSNNVSSQYLKCGASENCMRLLKALEKNYDDHYEATELSLPSKHSIKVFPNAASFNLALNALAYSCKGAVMAREAFLLLQRMLDRCRVYPADADKVGLSSRIAPPPEPSIITYNSVIHAIAKSRFIDGGFLAEEVFEQMEHWKKECDDGARQHQTRLYHGVMPNSRTFACMIDAWANADTVHDHGSSVVAERATAIFETALEKRRGYVRSAKGLPEEDININNDYSNEKDDLDEVLSFTDDDEGQMIDDDVVEETVDEDYFEDEPLCEISQNPLDTIHNPVNAAEPFLKPNTVALNTVLHAWSLSRMGYRGALRAHQLLEKTEHLSEMGDLDLPEGIQDPTIATDVEDDSVETQSLRPNARSYSIAMNVWANVGYVESHFGEEAAAKCEEILTRMEEQGAEDASTRPNLVAYTTCISAWARARDTLRAAARAENILNRMIDMYYDEGATELPALEGDLENAQHDAPFNAVITAYARNKDPAAPDRALAILDRLEASPIEPTATSYNAVMDACAKHGEPYRALSVLQRMKAKSIQPDPTSYDTILNAFARDETPGSSDRAWAFLQQMEEERMNGQSDFVATNFSYSSVINAFARAAGSRDGGIHVAQKAKKAYDKMIEQIEAGKLHGNDAFANSCLLNCCANVNGPSTEKRAALIMAINAFEEMKKNPTMHGEPNQFTFGTMMKASSRLSSDQDEKIRLLETLFTQACNRGCLSSAVLGVFLRNMPSDLSTKAIVSLGGTKRDIPPKWYRKVPEKHWPRGIDRPRRMDHGYRGKQRYANEY